MTRFLLFAFLFGLCAAQDAADYDLDFVGPSYNFQCPELNGRFPSEEQCDLYFLCEDGEYTPVLCDDGLVFDYSSRNRERCVYPQNVDCGNRKLKQKPTEGIDEKCERANGFFNHPKFCNKFISCDKGTAYEMQCSSPLLFDIEIGTCVHKNTRSKRAKLCNEDGTEDDLPEIEGFRCPGKERIGPQGLLQQHPIFPHPSDCQFFFTCYFGREPHKFGCGNGTVFDADTQVCKPTEEVSDCACWYNCGENSNCPNSCNADCSCPSAAEIAQFEDDY